MMNPSLKTIAQALLSVTGLLLLGGCGNGTPPAANAAQNAPQTGEVVSGQDDQHHELTLIKPALPDGRTLSPLPKLSGPKTPLPLRPLALNAQPDVVALKVLILSAGSSDPSLDSAKTMLDQAGVPYDVLDPSVSGLTESNLVAEDGSGKYQGIMLTTGNLSYEASPGVYQSALDWTGWNVLWQYEHDYSVRQLSLYTYPSSWPEDYGLRDAGNASGSADAKLTASGAAVFGDLKSGLSLPIRNAYNYPASLASVAGVTTTPLLTSASGQVLAARSDTAGRERIALTFAQNPYLLHSSLLGNSLVTWLTKGVHLGEYHRFNQLDIDDWFLAGDVFDDKTKTLKPDAFRISASDAMSLPVQQAVLRAKYPVSSAFKFAMMFNGGGANTSAPASCNPFVRSVDPLSSVSRCLKTQFDWVSHTKDHLYMDFLNYADSYNQLKPNLDIGKTLGLNVSTRSLLTGDMSGLGYYNPEGDGLKTDFGLNASNVNFLQAAQNSGTLYLASNHSVSSQWDAGCTNCGLKHPLNANIFLVPRWPTNVFYSVTNPAQAVAGYNSVYGPGGTASYWDHALTYSEFLDKETDLALSHLLSGGAFPHYMHQDNLRQYAAGRSLAFDWEDALLAKYAAYSTLPLKTLRWDDLGTYVKSRTSYMKSGLSGTWNRATKTLTLNAGLGGSVYLTGANVPTGTPGSTELYAGQAISSFALSAGQTVTVPVR